MADIIDPAARRFANERARVVADAVEECYETLRRYQLDYAAIGGDALFPDTADFVADGSETDGRKRVSSQRVRGLNALASAIMTFLDGGTPSRISQVRAISVNGRARF